MNVQRTAAGLMLLALSALAGARDAAPSQRIAFNIDAPDMVRALIEFTRQSGLQLAYPTDGAASIPAPRVVGNLTAREALDRLLKDSGLKYEFTNERTISIGAVSTPATRQTTSTAGVPGQMRLAQVTPAQEGASTAARTEGVRQPVEEGGEVVVSGTRLRNAQGYAPTYVITQEEIKRRGFNTMEDIVRSLPANLSDLNSATGVNNYITGTGSQGNVVINLRGLGAENTLVLLNGRRLSGAAALDGNGTNVSGIPVNAIERIEIVTDGGSAIYGSDAVAGTVNIILRKDFVGSETAVRLEDSSNDGDAFSASQMFGMGWGSGNLTANLSYQKVKPINTRKTGFTTFVLNDIPGGGDLRPNRFEIIVDAPPYNSGVLGPNVDPDNFTIDDLDPSLIERDDEVGRYVSPETEHIGFWASVQHSFSDVLSGALDLSLSRTRSFYQGTGAPYVFFYLPSDSPVNPTGEGLYVTGTLDEALEAGLIGSPNAISNPEDMSVSAGLQWKLPVRDWRMLTDLSYSRSESRFVINNNLMVDENYEPAGLYAALANGSFNPFDMTSAGADVYSTFIGELYPDTPDTETGGITSYVEGLVARLPMGAMRGVLGGEWRREEASGFSGRFPSRPSRDISALFTEVSVPLVDPGRNIPGLASLDLKLAARREEYAVKGASFDGVEARRVSETFTNTSPNAQLSWRPVRDLRFSVSWGESFRAPGASDLFSGQVLSTINGAEQIFDPLAPNTGGAGGDAFVNTYYAGNPVLGPEVSETTTLSAAWTPQAVQGLSVGLAYSKIDFTDRIRNPSLFGDAGLARIIADPVTYAGFAPRDAQGNLLAIVIRPLNLALSVSEAVDFNTAYTFESGAGTFTAGLTTTYVMKRQDQFTAGQPVDDLVDNSLENVDRLRGAARLDWENKAYGASVTYTFASDYDNLDYDFFTGEYTKIADVKGISVWDVTGTYRARNGWRFLVGAKNLFDQDPPGIIFGRQPYDARRVDLRGRTLFGEVVKSF